VVIVRSLKNQVIELSRKAKIIIDMITLPDFANKSKRIRIESPRRIANPEQIFIGNNVFIGKNSTIAALEAKDNFSKNTKISIGNNVEATSGLQIHAIDNITIEDDVLFATNVFIVDCSHGYENPSIPYKNQNLTKIAPVIIKKGCWIGQNVVILQGVTIGEYTIVGANSVVTQSVPARCIAVGSPAKPIKKWDEKLQTWVKFND
jgi:acetyltransferase-like isoleucine patch superfamily enzyme